MPIYLVIPLQPDHQLLDQAIATHAEFVADRYQLQANRGWLIRYNGTSKELSDALEITGQPEGQHSPVGSALVVPISGYYGRGPTDMWEWLKTRFER